MKKAFYVLIVMVVMLGMLPSAAEAKKVTGMYVSDITGRVDPSITGYRYYLNVYIEDVDGNPVSGAKVQAKAQISNATLSAYTDESGKAEFFIYTEATYLHFIVDNVSKRGYIYLSELNLMSDIYLQAPPSP